MRVVIDEARTQAMSALTAKGLSAENASLVVAHLLDAEERGHADHGLLRIPRIVRALETARHAKPPTIQLKTSSCVAVDGHGGLGLVVAEFAARKLIDLTRESGMAVVSANNYVGTTGSLGYYARQCAADGVVAIAMCNSECAVAPAGGIDPIIGTNPIAISVPQRSGPPIVSDVSTAAMSYGKLALLMQQKRSAPDGVVLDQDGNPSNDPKDADNGCQLPMAGHKGYALGLAVELLAGPFIGSKAGRSAVPGSDGLLLIGMRADLFIEADEFAAQTGLLAAEIKNSRRGANVDEIYLPGERSDRAQAEARKTGVIAVADAVWQEILNLSSV